MNVLHTKRHESTAILGEKLVTFDEIFRDIQALEEELNSYECKY